MVLPALALIILIAAAAALWLSVSLRKHARAPAIAGAPGFAGMAPASIPLSPARAAVGPQPPPPAPGDFGSVQVTAGSLNGNRFPVPKAGLLIGRDASKCNVVIADDTVSKEHALDCAP